MLGLLGLKRIKVNDWHGAIVRDPTDRFYVVPTFHPSFLQRGAHNLIGTVLWDLQQAEKAVTHGRPPSDHSLVVDPPVDWFHAWVDTAIAMRQQDPWAYPISSDIETPDKAGGQDEGEISAEDRSFQILRVNVACHPDEGVTVPFLGPYIDELRRLHQSPGPLWGWNYQGYDFARCVASALLREDDFPKVVDLMWLAHRLHSDLPRGLGFWAPFYSAHGPWKHRAESEPGLYGAIDGLQTHRVGFGVIGDLQQTGMYEQAMRYVHDLMYMALRPAQLVGVQIDRPALVTFKAELGAKATHLLGKIQDCVPDELRILTPKGGLTKKPLENVLHVKATAFTRKGEERKGKPSSEIKLDLYKSAIVVERQVTRDILVCRTCGAEAVHRRHRCGPLRDPVRPSRTDAVADAVRPAADISLESRAVTRWFWQEPFNPDSPDQVLAYIKFRKHSPGRAKKTGKDSTNKETLKTLVGTGDPFYARLLDYRAVMKVKGTYVDGVERRLDPQDRIHPEPTFVPSTGRLSYVNPNITNVVADKEGKETLAAGFRQCVIATSGHRLLEVDFSGSEAVDLGWWMRDPQYITLATLGVHAGLASHILGRPYDPAWPNEEKGRYFKAIKESKDDAIALTYDRCKRFVHGYSYGLTITGMVLQFPELFPTKKVAEQYAAIFNHLAPKAGPFQRAVRELAFKQHYLGGPGVHPFGDKHEFWSVYTFKKITAGQYWKILKVCRTQGLDERTAPVTIINGQYFKMSLGEDGKRCLPPTTQVWMGDFSYKALGDVRVGDEVIGWTRAHRSRRAIYYKKVQESFSTDTLTRTKVLAVHRHIEPTLTLRLASGQVIRCTRDHLWLCLRRHEYTYVRADELRPNEKICRVDVVDPGVCPTNLRETAAWLGGFYDGEGSQNGVMQTFAVGKGDLVERAEAAFAALGFQTTRQRRGKKDWPTAWTKGTFLAWTGGRQEALKFARWVPSHRYVAQWADQMILSARFRRLDTIVGIEQNTLAEEVVCITTETGNFVADGLCSHNCVAFLPQSTTAGKLKEVLLRLFDPASPCYLGTIADGVTPLRAPIHDSLLLDVPARCFDLVAETVFREMQRPFTQLPCPEEWGLGPFLSTGVSAKTGKVGASWASLEKLSVPSFAELGVASDRITTAPLEDEAEDQDDFTREIA